MYIIEIGGYSNNICMTIIENQQGCLKDMQLYFLLQQTGKCLLLFFKSLTNLGDG
jgi:hypothetical protein